MANPPLTEKTVYLALKGMFPGDRNEIPPSTLKTIRKRIDKFKNVKIAALIKEHGLDSIATVAKVLLDDQIFQSNTKAKLRFPDTFHVLPPSEPEKAIPIVPKAVTSGTVAVQRAGTYSPEQILSIRDGIEAGNAEQRTKIGSENQSLDLVSLPLWDQHRLLVKIQYTLEKASFTYAETKLGGVLQREGWDCAEAVELNRWTKILSEYREELHLAEVNHSGKPLTTLLDWTAQLRHDAVHRARLSSNGLLQRMTAAVFFAQLLQDDECSKFVSNVREKTQSALEELVRDKQLLDTKLAQIKEEFAAKKAELDRRESELLEKTVKEHKEPVISVSGSLDRSSGNFGGTDVIHVLWKHECDLALPDDESSGSEGTVKSHVVTSTAVSAAPPVVIQVPDAADEVVKTAKAQWREGKKEKKSAIQQAKQEEEEEKEEKEGVDTEAIEEWGGTTESEVQGELRSGVVGDVHEDVHEDFEIVKQLSAPPIPVPIIDSGSITLALTDENSGPEKHKDDDSSEVEYYFECPEIMVDGHENTPKHPSQDPSLEQQVADTDSTDPTNKGRMKPEMTTASDAADTDVLGHDEKSLNEQSTSPAPAYIEKDEDNTHRDHTPVDNGTTNLEARPEHPAATAPPSHPLAVVPHSHQEELSWPGSVCIRSLANDPRLKLLPIANRTAGGGVPLH